MAEKLKFYIALQGCFQPDEYIRYGKLIEDLGFDRIYVYDDLMFYPSYPILNLIAEHTSKIELGPCVVNGFYRHPAIIASNAAFLDAVSCGRSVLGLGRGAFFDFLNMNNDEKFTRKGFKESLMLIKHLFQFDKENSFKGNIHNVTKKAVLRVSPPKNPYFITATWNKKMAYLAGKYANELQLAEVFTNTYFEELYKSFRKGSMNNGEFKKPTISIGGMTCVSDDKEKAMEVARNTVAIYIPYLKTILKNHHIDLNSEEIRKIDHYSKKGNYKKAAKYISDEIVNMLSLTGNPEQLAIKIKNIGQGFGVRGIMFSPPYGTYDTVEKNIENIANKLIPLLK